MNPSEGQRFGKYLLLERIGLGGMAEVFKAKTFGAEGFERLVAIKRILPHLVEDEDFVKMFVDEAKIAVQLNHPNIVGIQDLGRAEGTLFIAMEYVLGRDLRAIYEFEGAREGKTPVGLACHIVMKMCEALHHAHFATGARGEPLQVIHRDVSPQNVLVSFDGEVKVVDFGLAKAAGRMVQTQAGVVKGKLAYMSPEQLRGEDIDHRVDVFGLGIVLFELLAGERLFLGPSDLDTLRRVYEAKVPPLSALRPDCPPELEAIVRRALAKERDERFGTALEMHEELQAFVYASGLYCGASTLRQYLRDAFPDAAPPADAELPPFAPSPAETAHAIPKPTHRPPARRPPDPPVEAPPVTDPTPPAPAEPVALPPLAPPAVPRLEPSVSEPAPHFDDSTVLETGNAVGYPDDDTPTERPPPLEEASRTVTKGGDEVMEVDEEWETTELRTDPPGAPLAPATGFPAFGEDDDEPTLFASFPTGGPGRPERDEDDESEDFDDSTIVIDPRTSGSGSG